MVKTPLPWAKVALLLPTSVAEDILAWAEREAEDVPLRLVLTKVRQGGHPHIEASTSQTYRKRRLTGPGR